MSDKSSIEWTDATWNPTRGCDKVSPGCKNCYAETFAERFRGVKGHAYEQGFDFRLAREKLDQPLRWRRSRRVFVNSMSDLFHKDVPDEYIAAVFGVMAACPQHTFQILTKRAERLPHWFNWMKPQPRVDERSGFEWDARAASCFDKALDVAPHLRGSTWASEFMDRAHLIRWPLPNVWLGVSVEDQACAEKRIPHLVSAPAAVHFLSCEPLLGPVDLRRITLLHPEPPNGPGAWLDALTGHVAGPDDITDMTIDWVIVGGESGRGARRHNVEWARSLVKQCHNASVPVFVKQMGAVVIDRNDRFNTCQDTDPALDDHWPLDDPYRVEENINGFREEYQGAPVRIRLLDKKGKNPEEWPPDLRVRQFPEVGA